MLYEAAAATVLALHLVWLLFIMFGVFVSKGRPAIAAIHIAALVWGIAVEVGPWPCPLTAAEQHFQTQAGNAGYTGSFLVHYLDRVVYPDIPEAVLVTCAVAVCVFNLAVYVRRAFVR